MRKPGLLFSFFFFFTFFTGNCCFSQDEISFTTYYSSPRAEYHDLTVSERISFKLEEPPEPPEDKESDYGFISYSTKEDNIVFWDKEKINPSGETGGWDLFPFEKDVTESMEEVEQELHSDKPGNWSGGVYVPCINGEICVEACARFKTTCIDADSIDHYKDPVDGKHTDDIDKSATCFTASRIPAYVPAAGSEPEHRYYNRCLCVYKEKDDPEPAP